MNRRDFLKLTAAAAGAYALGGLSQRVYAQRRGESLVLGTWGGIWETTFKEQIVPPFEDATGGRVIFDIANSTERVAKIRAQMARQRMDIAMLTPEAMTLAMEEGLLEPIDLAKVPNVADVHPRFKEIFQQNGQLYATGISWSATGILWRKDLVPFEITSWKDLWRPELQNRVSVQNMPTLGAASFLIAASIVHGGDQYNVEPGWEALKTLRPNIRSFFQVSSAVLNELMSGEVWAAVTMAGQGLPYASQGVGITIPEEGTTYSLQAMGIPVNAPSLDYAHEFMDFTLEPEMQRRWAAATSVPPTNANANLDAETQTAFIETPEVVDQLFDIDFLHMARQMEPWSERWQREFI